MNSNNVQVKSLRIIHKAFPARLRQLPQPPQTIYMRGSASLQQLLTKPTLGVVGARKVSTYGRSVTSDLASTLARQNVVIISGLALGVDSLAHQAALDAGGCSIAVLPCGIETIYPGQHRWLAKNILSQQGLLVSEYGGDQLPRKDQFIARNRIVAALSDALLITEAAERSGSLHTARFALELGKPVLAVPGNITSPMSAGTNNLIKMGAVPITNPQDITETLGLSPAAADEEPSYYSETLEEEAIVTHLRAGVQDGQELLNLSQLDIATFQQHLTMLEIKDVIQPLGNNHWRLK